jgi:signal transduction histidine kinase
MTMKAHKPLLAALIVMLAAPLGWHVWELVYSPGVAVVDALARRAVLLGDDSDAKAMRALIDVLVANFKDTRLDATRWSGVFWGFSFAGLLASAAAALVLKIETLGWTDAARKDLAAALAFVAALTVSVSTTGDFQRKWQANRLAAAQFERLGYKLLAARSPALGEYYDEIGNIEYERTTLITGKVAERKATESSIDASRSPRPAGGPSPSSEAPH